MKIKNHRSTPLALSTEDLLESLNDSQPQNLQPRSQLNSILRENERPRERCLQFGSACLSLRECIALVLGSGPPSVGCLGLASLILDRPGPWEDPQEEAHVFFSSMEIAELGFLSNIRGMGPALQARIMAAFELGKRYSQYKTRTQTFIQPTQPQPSSRSLPLSHLSLQALAQISLQRRTATYEWLGFVPIHRNRELGAFCEVEKGVRTHVNIDPSELFARILILRPTGYFLFHNHPSGSMKPSAQDLDLTEKVSYLSDLLGIPLLGHWIVTATREHLIPQQPTLNSAH